MCVVEVDTETGEVEIVKLVTVDDAGKIMNPILIQGQVHGGVAQGIGQALYEQVVYDDEGYLLSGNLTSYLIPTSMDVPNIDVTNTETPTPHNPLGVKGIGEAERSVRPRPYTTQYLTPSATTSVSTTSTCHSPRTGCGPPSTRPPIWVDHDVVHVSLSIPIGCLVSATQQKSAIHTRGSLIMGESCPGQ